MFVFCKKVYSLRVIVLRTPLLKSEMKKITRNARDFRRLLILTSVPGLREYAPPPLLLPPSHSFKSYCILAFYALIFKDISKYVAWKLGSNSYR